MPIKSLVELCTGVCLKNIKEIQDVGGTPYHIIRRILLQINSAEQLSCIEMASPHIADEDAECWMRIIERDFPSLVKQHNFEPKNPANWRKVYKKYKHIDEEQKKLAQEKLKNAFANIKQKKEANTSEIVTFDRRKMPQPPRDARGDPNKKSAVGRRGGNNDTGELRFTGGTRTKVNDAKSIMRKVKREAREIHNRNRIGLATPQVRSGQIKQAPQGMIQAERLKNQPAVKIRPPVSKPRIDHARDDEMQAREERLRRLKGQSMTIVSGSESEGEDDYDTRGGGYIHDGASGGLDEDDLEALFDKDEEEDAKPRKSTFPSQQIRSSSSSASQKPGKRSGLLSNSHRPSSSASIQRAPAKPALKPAVQEQRRSNPAPARMVTSPPLAAASPPKPSSSAVGQSGSPELKPRMPIKRKAANIFMAMKPKVQKR